MAPSSTGEAPLIVGVVAVEGGLLLPATKGVSTDLRHAGLDVVCGVRLAGLDFDERRNSIMLISLLAHIALRSTSSVYGER